MEQPQRSWQEQPPQLCPGRAEFPVGSAHGRGSTPKGSCLVPSLLAAEVFRSCAVILGSSAIVWLPEGCWAGVGSLSSDSLMNSRPANEDWLRASSLASALRQEKGFLQNSQAAPTPHQHRGTVERTPQLGVEEFGILVPTESGVQGPDSLQVLSWAGGCPGGLVGKCGCCFQPPQSTSSSGALS